jgi:hypothetical protein
MDELPIAERAEACRPVLEARGYLIIRRGPVPMGEIEEVDSVEAAFARFRAVADYLRLEIEELADGGLIAFLPEVSTPMRAICAQAESAYLN